MALAAVKELTDDMWKTEAGEIIAKANNMPGNSLLCLVDVLENKGYINVDVIRCVDFEDEPICHSIRPANIKAEDVVCCEDGSGIFITNKKTIEFIADTKNNNK